MLLLSASYYVNVCFWLQRKCFLCIQYVESMEQYGFIDSFVLIYLCDAGVETPGIATVVVL